MPIEPVSAEQLYEMAARLVAACRGWNGDSGTEWLATELDDGRRFVADQLVDDSNDAEWSRIDAVLAGAQAGLAASRRRQRRIC